MIPPFQQHQAATKDLAKLEERFWTTLEQSDESCFRTGLGLDLMKRALDPNWMASYRAQLAAQGTPFPPLALAASLYGACVCMRCVGASACCCVEVIVSCIL
jgi:hypothetical protein